MLSTILAWKLGDSRQLCGFDSFIGSGAGTGFAVSKVPHKSVADESTHVIKLLQWPLTVCHCARLQTEQNSFTVGDTMTLTARPVTVSNIRTHCLPSRPLQGSKASASCLCLALTKVVRTSMAELTSQSDRFGMIPIIGFRFGISDSAKLTGQCIMQLAKRRRSMRPMVHHHCQSDPDHDDLAVGRGHWRNRWAGPRLRPGAALAAGGAQYVQTVSPR